MFTTVQVIKEWQPNYPDPIVLKAGETVAVEDRPSEWPGWIWCTAASGKSGWTPIAYLDRTGDTARALHDYSAVELAVQPGDEVTLLESESG